MPVDLRVLQLVPVLALGGLERVTVGLTLELAPRVERIAVAGMTGRPEEAGGPAIEGPLRENGIPVYHMRRPVTRPDLLVRSALSLVPVLRTERPDVIHAHNPTGGAAAGLARRFARMSPAVVTTYHGVTPERVGLATRVLAHSSDVVVGVSPTATRALHAAGLARDRSATILNAVTVAPTRTRADVRAELGIAGDAQVIVTVGRYAPEKNQALLLDALERILPGRPTVHALVIGHGVLEAELRERAAAIDAERIHITGARLDAIDLVAASDLFVLSSDSEAFPLALLEAMSVGLPVVTTDVGGVRDAVTDGVDGVVVPPRDPAALANAISSLLDDPARGRELGAGAAQWVAEHSSVRAMADAYLELYSEVASVGRKRASARRAGASPSK